MQGTTRSVEAVEGIVVEAAKAMASGGTVSFSASAGGVKSSVVLSNHGGGGRHNKRKGLPGGGVHSSTITIGKKKFCSSTNEIAKPAATTAATNVVVTTMKKKERFVDPEMIGDPSLEDAALALTEFAFLAHKPAVHSSPPSIHKSVPAALPQWKITKLRSGRTRRVESSSNEDSSHLATATTDSSYLSPLPLHKQQQQVSECSSSPCGDSQSVITLVKVEDGAFCSSTGVEEEEQVEQHQVVEVVVEEEVQDENNNTNANNKFSPSDFDRLVLPKLTSVSSIDSGFQPDSRAESPSSPLPDVLRTGEFASVCGVAPKCEGSAFRRVVPIRPVKKPTFCRKLKVEEKTFEDLNPEQAAVKHISRKKPRPTGFVPQQQQVQQQQQFAPVKIEEADAFCALALGPPRLIAEEEVEVKKFGLVSSIAPAPTAAAAADVAVEEKPVKLDAIVIKLETKLSGKLVQRTSSKVKPALSESEKEARKQRRVQANRESARLTIRKKQVLCEELSRKAQVLSTENGAFRKEVERMVQEKKNISELNAKLKDQVAKAAGKHEPGSSAPTPPSMEKPPDGLVQYQFPAHQFGGLPMATPFVWAFALSQAQAAAQAAGVQPSEINIGSPEFAAFFAATAAAAACGNNAQVGFWNGASSSQGQSSMLPPFFPGHHPGASVASALPSYCGTPASISPITRSISLPVGPADPSFSLESSDRSLLSGKPVASYRSGEFADSVHLSHDLKKHAVKQDSTHQGSCFSGRTHYFQMAPGNPSGMPTNGVGNGAAQKSGDGSGLHMSNAGGQPLSRSHSLSTPQMSKLHSRYPMFGSGGMSITQERPSSRESEAQRVAAAAAEARRKRIELKRTKSQSLLNRQIARVAESSAL